MAEPIDLDEFCGVLRGATLSGWQPVIVRLAPGEHDVLTELCRQHGITVLDTIDLQLTELAAVRFPSPDQVEARDRFIADELASAGDRAAYGVWVYLSWAGTIGHLLAEDDYFDVLTDRNRDKITREEQRALRGKCVGVLGLSVGGEAAVTVAQENLCGHLKLADFDRLDLSNLNRLNAGFTDLDVPKARIVARRVAAINPFLRITVFEQAVTPENATDLLDGLDLLVEECDSLPTKHALRLLAMARGVDVVYAADERGFLSIEPYRSYPDLQPFHGRAGDQPLPRAAYPSPSAFLRALTHWIGGWDNLSERSRRSVAEVGISLGGYPQLAGEARYAAAQIAHVARRLLLGERIPPFCRQLDLHDLIPGDGQSP
ncbi:ThiF family adenylyltransferase [Amycolatopsis nigrescens]|uniref:ThiF family adenylyltransferase n=1 Tax=Amycolatopsis nigrescens TaxID=381445 RepID=UPI0003608667|nr:ThiF family adenylyltransferase [Amycolatopsis nigrescens]